MVTVGAVVSRTVTRNSAWLVFPDASLALQATTVVPSGNVEPDAGAQLALGAGSTTSAADGAAYATAAPAADVASATRSSETVGLGATESTTLTTNDPVASAPLESKTEQCTVVAPSGKNDPDAGAHVGVSGPSS
jgi:hypothetical protein